MDLGEANEFNERRIYDDQNTSDLLTIAVEVLGKKPINLDMWSRVSCSCKCCFRVIFTGENGNVFSQQEL